MHPIAGRLRIDPGAYLLMIFVRLGFAANSVLSDSARARNGEEFPAYNHFIETLRLRPTDRLVERG